MTICLGVVIIYGEGGGLVNGENNDWKLFWPPSRLKANFLCLPPHKSRNFSLPQKIVCTFPLLGLKCEHFLKQIFGYTALHCALIDRIWSVNCTCLVCLCKYHNWVTQGVGNLLNLVGPTPTRRNRGWRRAGKFWKFWVSRSLEMAFS
jgi:hypothetical protein